MVTHEDTGSNKKIEVLTNYFSSAKDNPALLKKLGADPIAVLQSMGIAVEDEFKDAVTSQLQTLTATEPAQTHSKEVTLMTAQARELPESVVNMKLERAPAAPTNLTVKSVSEPGKAEHAAAKSLELWVKPWGVVLVVHEPAVKYLQGGGTISAGVLGGIGGVSGLGGLAAATSVLDPLGIVVGAVVGICAAALGIYSGVIGIMDEGKGVYLTWTWAQFIPFLVPPFIPNPMYGLPVVTTIK